MAVYESLLLNTAVPQIQAAQAGDSYVMVVNATTPALRITQTGTGDSILVEDAANPDSSPFVVSAAGDVGIGTSTPAGVLSIKTSNGQFLVQNGTSAAQMRISAFNNAGNANAALIFEGYASEYGRFDSSGNLGLGVTPSGWGSGITAFQLAKDTSVSSHTTGGNIFINSNTYYNGSNWIYSATRAASQYQQNNGLHVWYTAASGTAGATTSITSGSAYSVTTLGSTTLGEWQAYFSALTGIPSIGQTVTATATGTLAGGATVTQIAVFTQAMTLDASGNLIIGDTSGAAALNLVRGGSDSTEIKLKQTGTGGRDYRILSSGSGYGSAGNLIFYDATASAERARIDSSGNLLIGSPTNTTVSNLILNGATRWAVGTQSGGNLFYIVRDSDGVGQYMVNGSTSWTAASDERNKDIIETISDAANKVSTLRAVIGKYKTDEEGTRRSFLIAQDVQKVLPEAVDATNPEKLGVAYTETIPLLVAAIQEQQAMINELKAEVAALKGA
jgi:hypothetical protein